MAKKEFNRVTDYQESDEELARFEDIRSKVKEEFPPKPHKPMPAVGIGKDFRDARESLGLSWYAVAKQAGIPNSRTVRDIELGHDVKLSSLQAVAKVLGLRVTVDAA